MNSSYRFDEQNTVSKLTPEQIKLIDYLNKQSDGEIYLNYIWGSDNNLEVYFRTNSLSTRMWWFNMYYWKVMIIFSIPINFIVKS